MYIAATLDIISSQRKNSNPLYCFTPLRIHFEMLPGFELGKVHLVHAGYFSDDAAHRCNGFAFCVDNGCRSVSVFLQTVEDIRTDGRAFDRAGGGDPFTRIRAKACFTSFDHQQAREVNRLFILKLIILNLFPGRNRELLAGVLQARNQDLAGLGQPADFRRMMKKGIQQVFHQEGLSLRISDINEVNILKLPFDRRDQRQPFNSKCLSRGRRTYFESALEE